MKLKDLRLDELFIDSQVSMQKQKPVPLWTLKSVYLLATGSSAFITKFSAIYFDHIGFNALLISYIFVGSNVSTLIGNNFWSFLGDRTTKIKTTISHFLLFGCGLCHNYSFERQFLLYLWRCCRSYIYVLNLLWSFRCSCSLGIEKRWGKLWQATFNGVPWVGEFFLLLLEF